MISSWVYSDFEWVTPATNWVIAVQRVVGGKKAEMLQATNETHTSSTIPPWRGIAIWVEAQATCVLVLALVLLLAWHRAAALVDGCMAQATHNLASLDSLGIEATPQLPALHGLP